MAVDYTGTIQPVQPSRPSPVQWVGMHPYISIIGALLVAVVVGYIWNTVHQSGSSTSGNTNAPGTTEGLPATNAQGQPVYYVPTSNTFLDYNNVTGSYNDTASTTTTNTTTNTEEEHPTQNVPTPTPTPVPVWKPPVPVFPRGTGPRYSGKSPFPYRFGQPNFNWTGPDGVKWSVGFGPEGRVWGVPGQNISSLTWGRTAIPPKTLLYQD